jgi:biopolymer transport protein TolR
MAGSSMRGGRPRKFKSEINVVPYIDVMLVLLIIFMVTAPMLNLGADIQLPQSAAKALQDEKQPVLVTVDQQGQVFLTLGKSAREQVDDETLVKDVSAFVKQDPKASVMLGGDKRVDYGRVNQVLGLLQQAGVAKVGLMSQPETTVVPASNGKR